MTSQLALHRAMHIAPGMRAQVKGYTAPATITSVGEWDSEAWDGVRRLGSRKVWLVLDADKAGQGDAAPVEMADSDILATWSPEFGYGDNFAAVRTFDRLHLHALDPVTCARSGGYWYTVTAGAFAHTAFVDRAQVMSWLNERGLQLGAELPEAGTAGDFPVVGCYRESVAAHTLGFDNLVGVRTRVMSNGHWTAATISADADGIRTVHSVGPNCRAREEFDVHTWPAPGERLYFYVPGQLRVIDQVVLGEDDTPVGMYSGATLAQLRREHSNTVICTSSEFRAQSNAAARTVPEEITQETFHRMLDALPPEGWTRRGDSESFKLAEYYSGDVTSIYVRVGDRYFSFRDVGSLPHDQAISTIERAGLFEPALQEDEPSGLAP